MGPLPSGHSLLVIVDYYSRFYEVEVMQSTTTEKVIDRLADTFCRHGLPNTIKSDNGPQLKSNEFREYCEQHGIIHQKVTAKWAQANGEVERQNRSLLKRLQIAQAENRPLRAEFRKYLTAYRSNPHNTTGRSPAELLFNRKFKGKISDLSIDHAYAHEVHDRDAEQKAKSKTYADIHRSASPSSPELGDEVLVQQDKTNKLSTAFDPNPFKVVSKTGNSLVVERPTGNQYSRNTSHVEQYISEGDLTPQLGSDSESKPPKPQQELDPVPSPCEPTVPESTAGLLDRGECRDLQDNVGAAPEPSRNLRPQRTRRLPERLRDYIVNFLWGT